MADICSGFIIIEMFISIPNKQKNLLHIRLCEFIVILVHVLVSIQNNPLAILTVRS